MHSRSAAELRGADVLRGTRSRQAHALQKCWGMNEIGTLDPATLALAVGGYGNDSVNGVPPLIGGDLPKPKYPAMYPHPDGKGCSLETGGQGMLSGYELSS